MVEAVSSERNTNLGNLIEVKGRLLGILTRLPFGSGILRFGRFLLFGGL